MGQLLLAALGAVHQLGQLERQMVAAVPAMVMIGVWILTQIASVFFLQEDTAGGGVAFWAHIGGFIAGLLLSFLLPSSEKDRADRTAPGGSTP